MRYLPQRRSIAALRNIEHSSHTRTIGIALISNVLIAVAKLVAGLMTGSAGMLAESGHSFADTINEILLGISLKRSQKSADPLHPFGHGRERFLWAFVAALASFIIGGCVSIGLAIRQFTATERTENQTASWIVLAFALVADGVSWLQSLKQSREEAGIRGMGLRSYLKRTSDPILRAIVVEDSAAVIGTFIAAGGLLASHLLSSPIPDAIASLLIGILLAGTAIGLARPLADFLIGRSLPSELLNQIHEIMATSPLIKSVIGVQAIYTGPEEVIVAAKIVPSCSAVAELAAEMDKLDSQIRETVPFVADVFIDITQVADPRPKAST